MGASRWTYFTALGTTEQGALDALREEVFARDAEYYADSGVETLADLMSSGILEEEPAHSILDVDRVVRCEPDLESPGEIRVVEGPEVPELFGTPTPTRELLEEAIKRRGDGCFPPFGRGSGCCTRVFSADGHPESLCFWGSTGD